MPGILDSLFGGGGLLGGAPDQQTGVMSPADLYGGGLKGRLASSLAIMNPQAGNAYLQQRMMPMQYQALAQQYGPSAAMMFLSNPSLLAEMVKPQVVAPGGSLMSGMGIPGVTGQQGQQQQPMPPPQAGPLSPGLAAQAGRPPGLPQLGQAPAQPQAPQPAQPSGGGVTLGQNTSGVMSDDQLMPMAQQYVLGKDNAFDPLGRTMTGVGGLNRARGMALVRQLMMQQNMTSQDLAANQMKYQGLKGTINDIYKTNNALNTGVGHVGQLLDVFNNLGNSSFKPSNYVKNLIGDIIGKPGPVNYEAVVSRVAPEITRIWRGSGGAEADIERDIKTLSSSNAPEQGIGAISNIARLMGSKMDTNNYQFESVFGPHSGDFMVTPQNKALLQKLEGLARAGQNGGAVPQISPKAIEALKAHPEKRGEFDAKFGPGASQKVLGNGQFL